MDNIYISDIRSAPLAVYSIQYKDLPGEEFRTQKAVKSYLKSEKEAWSELLDLDSGTKIALHVLAPNSEFLTLGRMVSSFDDLLSHVGDEQAFNALADGKENSLPLPPPSKSYEGAAILSLFQSERIETAVMMLQAFLHDHRSMSPHVPNIAAQERLREGRTALRTISAVASFVPNDANLNQIRVDSDQAEIELARVHQLIDEGEARAEEHNTKFDERTQKESERSEERVRAFQSESEARWEQFKQHLAEFETMVADYKSHMETDAPVVLWGSRAERHSQRSVRAMWWFIGLGAFTIAAALGTAICFGDAIAASFSREVCVVQAGVQSCETVFSYEGPVLVASLLVAFSVLLWATRLPYKMFLSERHLSLDAEEKTAFAKSFAAINQDKSIDKENENIVLAALFRPTPDGIIKDDDGGLDPSISAAIAKFLSRS